MKLKVFDDHDALSEYVAAEILRTVKEKPEALISVTSGSSPTLAYEKLVGRLKNSDVDISRASFVGLDEWVGMDPKTEGSCHQYLNEYLFRHFPTPKKNIRIFDGLSKDLAAECTGMDEFVKARGPIDIMILGLGVNGHVGFNEPGVSEDLYSHVIDLEPITIEVGKKYFPSSEPSTRGITLGFRHIFNARKVLLMANGAHKADIVSKVIHGTVTNEIPASLLKKHRACEFCVDVAASAKVKNDF